MPTLNSSVKEVIIELTLARSILSKNTWMLFDAFLYDVCNVF
jgi:hypothetical protein